MVIKTYGGWNYRMYFSNDVQCRSIAPRNLNKKDSPPFGCTTTDTNSVAGGKPASLLCLVHCALQRISCLSFLLSGSTVRAWNAAHQAVAEAEYSANPAQLFLHLSDLAGWHKSPSSSGCRTRYTATGSCLFNSLVAASDSSRRSIQTEWRYV